MEKAIVSVIVPVYNVENYIHRCLASICSQTYSALEILIVDDGSPDNSIDICEEFRKKDGRIKIFRKKNGGLASARNVGLEMASGNYIMCVDSDDWIESNMVEVMVNDLEGFQVDMVVCDYYIDSNGSSKYEKKKTEEKIKLDKNKAMEFALSPEKYYGFAWNKIYKREIINEQRYNEEFKKGEDSPFTCEYINKCTSVLYDMTPLYHYRSDSNSITRSSFAEWKMSVLDSYSSIIDLLKENNYPSELVEFQKSRYANQLLSLSINIVSTDLNKYKKQMEFLQIKMKEYSDVYFTAKNIDFAHKTAYACAMRSPRILQFACMMKGK